MPPKPPSPPPVPTAPPPPIGGRYRLLDVGGRGGMAVVWRAEQTGPRGFSRHVAVKQMHPHLATDAYYRDMFAEEARVMAAISDANVPQIHEFVEERGQLYLVMEWIDGIDLATYIRYVRDIEERPPRWDHVGAVGVGVLRGLAAAHERRGPDNTPHPVVHRDVSPHNVLISQKGIAKLIDFGLSLADDRDAEDTDPGLAKGKLPYLCPEIVRGGRATPQSDQFAVGATLWEALVGHKAFEGDTQFETYSRLANAQFTPLEQIRPDLPPAMIALVHRAMALRPEDRFPTSREMARQLGRMLASSDAVEDLYVSLATMVEKARHGLRIGRRTMDFSVAEPIEEDLSGLTELLPVDIEASEKGDRGWVPSILDRIRGKG
ncbi:MAG: serine/threonine-protein kinase [Sandaracinaceae bacterium]